MAQRSPPFGIYESTYTKSSNVVPSNIAPMDLYQKAMGSSEIAQKAQLAIATRYSYEPEKWLRLLRTAESNIAMKSGLRCVIQAQTILAFLTGSYNTPWGVVDLSRSGWNTSIAETKMLSGRMELEFLGGTTRSSITDSHTWKKIRMKANEITAQSKLSRPSMINIAVVEGDTLDVAIQLERVFRATPLVVIPINPSVPGGFYRRGGAAYEEEVHRRSSLWSNLDDPYSGSKRTWEYPLEEGSIIWAPNVTIIRSSEKTGYRFLNRPGKVACICVSPSMIHEYIDSETSKVVNYGTLKSCSIGGLSPVWKGKLGNKLPEPLLTTKAAAKYTKTVETILTAALNEKRRIIILNAFACGSSRTPPRHAAKIHKEVLERIDPRGESFDLVVFAISEDTCSYQPHNPNGNLIPFAEELAGGNITSFKALTELDAVDETEYEMYTRKFRPAYGEKGSSSHNSLATLAEPISSLSCCANSKDSVDTLSQSVELFHVRNGPHDSGQRIPRGITGKLNDVPKKSK